ncbi:hypothetical protein LCGC14_1533360 [marine sediment metagenome]|uniref:Nucleotide-diphospho-sugar transferase domain-containing protein n=1 Tax=marine sediment metagenome TaxID=412755 RepID=A0A0F9IVC8_9ZZZZ
MNCIQNFRRLLVIAILVYKSETSRKDPDRRFKHWLNFYRLSQTNLPIRIFTDYKSEIQTLNGYPVTSISAIPPISSSNNVLAYGDWLRAELYDIIQQPFVYMDIDCLLLQPIDDIIESVNTGMAMAFNAGEAVVRLTSFFAEDKYEQLNKHFNSGVMVFNRSFKEEYRKQFQDNPNNHNRNWMIYGELIWGDINRKHGSMLDSEYNVLISDVISNHFRPTNPKILHCHGDSVEDVLSLVRWISSSFRHSLNAN